MLTGETEEEGLGKVPLYMYMACYWPELGESG